MISKQPMFRIVIVLGLVAKSLIGCQWQEREGQQPTTPSVVNSSSLLNYAQMDNGSVVVDGQQINWVVSDWGSFPYEQCQNLLAR